ncbi:MAG TPA: glycosyltransferase family 39 protein [Thermoanaerobaculia bacterium]|nr:glycosyltransferase family 39 protein [Thermoanaerobaculia bacterium]
MADGRAAAAPFWRSPGVWAGFAAVALARLLSLPVSVWEYDEILFMRGVERFAPLEHRPHPPGYPLTIGLGKLLAPIAGDSFHALVAVSVIASLVGYLALADVFARILAPAAVPTVVERRQGVVAALLFHLSPPMLLYGPLALSDAPALCFLALALAAGARLLNGGIGAAVALGAFAAGAVGCRPQLAVAVGPMVAAAWIVAVVKRRREATSSPVDDGLADSTALAATGGPAGDASRAARAPRARTLALAAIAGYAVVGLAWLIPDIEASGGPIHLIKLVRRQARLVAAVDAGLARGALGAGALVARFVAHPWGPKQLSIPVLLLAIAGLVELARRRCLAALPLLLLAIVDLAFALRVMDPADAVRYALPSLLGVSFLAVVGLYTLAGSVRLRALAPLGAAVLVAGFVLYTFPILQERSTLPSPPVQAARWAATHLPPNAQVLVAPPLVPHAAQLLGGRAFTEADPGLSAPGSTEARPAFLLADGPGGWPGAVTFRWPGSEGWGKLTRGYYRVVSWNPLPACRFAAGFGVYGWEPGWRWLAQDASLRVFTGGARRLGIELGLPPTSPFAEVLVDVQAGDGAPVQVRALRGRRRRASLEVPAAPAVDVHLHADRAFVPVAGGLGTDQRGLAVQLLGCEVSNGR